MSEPSATMWERPPVYVRRGDLAELWRIAARARNASPEAGLFLEEFERLRIAPETDADAFVRLGSWVLYKDLRSSRQRRIRLVRPGRRNAEKNEVSLYSPIGGALIGLTTGAIFRWVAPDGRLRAIQVLDVTHG